MLITYTEDGAILSADRYTVDKARTLLELFADATMDSLQVMLGSSAGSLAYSVLCNQTDTALVRMLIDELLEVHISTETNKAFVSRSALLAELEDILKAKVITPYRRSRINKALKRECIACHGSGKSPKKVRIPGDTTKPVTIRHEISINSPDCIHCCGTGRKDIKQTEVPTQGSAEAIEQCSKQMQKAGEEHAKELNDAIFKSIGVLP